MVRVRNFEVWEVEDPNGSTMQFIFIFSTFIYPNLTRNLYVVIEAVQHRQYCVWDTG